MFFFSFGLLFSGPVQVAEKDVPESSEAKPKEACSWNVQLRAVGFSVFFFKCKAGFGEKA